MAKTKCVCPNCKTEFMGNNGEITRAKKLDYNISCSISCAGAIRRSGITKEQQVKNKAEYDRMYRAKNIEKIARNKKEYHSKNYDPVKQAARNKSRAKLHLEYCRRPEYKEKKRAYDKRYLANKRFGEFGECFLALKDVEKAVAEKATQYEVKLANGLLGKSQKRKAEYERINSTKSEASSLGNLERC